MELCYVEIKRNVVPILTLVAMIYLGFKQREMTKRQINLGLYEKRYMIYMDLEKLINELIDKGLPQSNSDFDEYVSICGRRVFNFKSKRSDREFLLEDELNEYITRVLKELEQIPTNIVRIYQNNSSHNQYNQAIEEFNKFLVFSSELHKKFKVCLDFRKI